MDNKKMLKNMAMVLGLPIIIILIFSAINSLTAQKSYNYYTIILIILYVIVYMKAVFLSSAPERL